MVNKRFLVIVGLLLSVLDPARAELPPLIPREILFGNPERTAPRISPDGTQLAYLAPDQGVLNVWVRTIGKTDDHPVTKERHRGLRNYSWAQNGKYVLYAQDKDGDEDFHIYAATPQGDEIRDLTPIAKVRAELVAVDPAFPDDVLIALNDRDPKFHDVHRLNVISGERKLIAQNTGDVSDWAADSKFIVRAAVAALPDGGLQLRLRDSAESEWRPVITWTSDDSMGARLYGFSPNDKGVYVASSLGTDTARLLEVDAHSGDTRVLSEDPQADVEDVLVHPTRHQVQAAQFIKQRSDWKVLDESIKDDFAAIRKLAEGDFQVISRDTQDQNWLISFTLDTGPVKFYAYERAAKKGTFLFSNQPKLEGLNLAKMKPVSIQARDGFQLISYLTLPVGLESKDLPLVLLVHGGPWGRDTWGYNASHQWLANRGYAVLSVNYRGSTGFGKKFVNAGDREWGRHMQNDLTDAVQWAIKEGIANPKKVAIMGGSYGGYATLAGLAFTPDLYACGVDIVGPSNLITLLQSFPPYWETGRKMFYKRVGDPEKDADFLQSRSPLFSADKIKAPLLIGHGANDPRVKQAEADRIFEALKEKHQPVEYIVFADEGHGFNRPENRMKFNAAAEAFLAKYLGGRCEPAADSEKVDIRS
jgi:dipeptidyl aminopeptidase/acylaminoacyl peptidase